MLAYLIKEGQNLFIFYKTFSDARRNDNVGIWELVIMLTEYCPHPALKFMSPDGISIMVRNGDAKPWV